MKRNQGVIVALIALLLFTPSLGYGKDLKVAVAANFTATIKMIASAYENETGERVILAFGSTGKHYAQIKNGAPFDMFLAADSRRPFLLEKENIAVPDSRVTYALGKLVLWSADPDYAIQDGDALERGDFGFLAIANPKLAPYGLAAKEVLQARGHWLDLRKKIVQGENISQTYQYILSGNAKLGFIAYSQIKIPDKPIPGSHWVVPGDLYQPIEQQMVLLNDKRNAWRFWNYIQGDTALNIIESFGYSVRD